MSRLVHSTSCLFPVAIALGAFACSGSSDTSVGDAPPATAAADSGAGASATGKPATPSSSVPPTSSSDASVVSSGDAASSADGGGANCVPPGYAGNEKKIGAYCDDKVSCPFQIDPFLICTFGHDPTNTHLFCTTPCSKDSECGSGAYCVHDTAGAGCVPTQCGGAPGS